MPRQESLLDVFDRDERYEADDPALRREEFPDIVRHVAEPGGEGVVLMSRLNDATADTAIDAQLAYFHSIGQPFEWKVYGHDQPANLVDRLRARGFTVGEVESVMVLDLAVAPPIDVPEASVTVRRVTGPDDLEVLTRVKQGVYGPDTRGLIESLAREQSADPHRLSMYIGYVNHEPAACAWVRFRHRGSFASLWGGSTVPERRRQGLYTALLAARLDEIRSRGFRYVTVDASPMSRPILEKRGFVEITTTTPCTWGDRG